MVQHLPTMNAPNMHTNYQNAHSIHNDNASIKAIPATTFPQLLVDLVALQCKLHNLPLLDWLIEWA